MTERIRPAPEPAPGTAERPRVAVVMPAYNAEKTLERTWADIPKGSVDDVILVDDASRDRTVEEARRLGLHPLIAEDIAEKNDRAKIEVVGDAIHLVTLDYGDGALAHLGLDPAALLRVEAGEPRCRPQHLQQGRTVHGWRGCGGSHGEVARRRDYPSVGRLPAPIVIAPTFGGRGGPYTRRPQGKAAGAQG